MGEVDLKGIRIVLPRQLSAAEERLPVRYRVSAQQVSVGPIAKPIGELPIQEG
jgi:hypothetical protein